MWIYDHPLSGGYREKVCVSSKTEGFASFLFYSTTVAMLIEIDMCQLTESCPCSLCCCIIDDYESTPYRFQMQLGFAPLQICPAKLM